MSAVLIFLTLMLVLAFTAYLYVQNAYLYWKKRGVPFLEPKFPFGNFEPMFRVLKSFPEMLRELYNSTDEPVVGVYTVTSPTLLLRDPKIIRDIVIKDFTSFYHRGIAVNEDVDPMARNLFLINGEKWKQNRTKFSPAFTTGRLKAMFDTIRNCGDALDKHVAPYVKSGEIVEIRDVLARFATNVIS